MAVNVATESEKKLQGSYPGASESLRMPRTPLESRQGYHPKKVCSVACVLLSCSQETLQPHTAFLMAV